jgi:hypothetical protein
MADQDEYGSHGGQVVQTHIAASDPEAGARGQSALDAEARDKKRSELIAAKEGTTTSGDDPKPKASDFGGDLGKWSAATRAWTQRQTAKNPQAQAVKGMLAKDAGAQASQ